jgi:hypothetical protein
MKYITLDLSSRIPTLLEIPNPRPKGFSGDCVTISSSIDSQPSIETSKGGVLTTSFLSLPPNSLCSQLVTEIQREIQRFQIPRLCSNSSVQGKTFWERGF